MQAFLSKQHAVHSAISAGKTAVQTLSLPEGALSPDLRKQASLADGHLRLVQLPEQSQLSSWELPARPYCEAAQYRWSLDNRLLALPWGPWGEPEHAPAVGPAGFLIVDTTQADR